MTQVGTSFDDRRSSIEVQTNAPLILDSTVVKAMVVPSVIVDHNPALDGALQRWDADLLTYPMFHVNPRESTLLLFDRVHEYLARHQYV